MFVGVQPEATNGRPLKVGLILPETERQMNGGSARWSDLREMAQLGEQIGADSLWITDHLIHRVPGEEPRGMWECWSLISALAAITETPEIGTLVLSTSFRNPALLAKMADTVEEISGGRLILGLGAGWNEAEYIAFGYPFDHRVSRFEEAVTIITGLLQDGHVDFEGTYYQARDCELRPRGPRPNGPPIIFGASSAGPRMLDLTARYADGWNTWFSSTGNRVEGLLPLLEKVDAACEAAGRDPRDAGAQCGGDRRGRTARALGHDRSAADRESGRDRRGSARVRRRRSLPRPGLAGAEHARRHRGLRSGAGGVGSTR